MTHRVAGLRISRVDPSTLKPRDPFAEKSLPDLEPPEERLQRAKSHIFSSDAISLNHASAMDDVFEPNKRAEHHDVVARATVYVINMIVMVFAMPVGLGLLCFNILGGENLRTTAHVLALTGMFMVLTLSGAGSTAISAVLGG